MSALRMSSAVQSQRVVGFGRATTSRAPLSGSQECSAPRARLAETLIAPCDHHFNPSCGSGRRGRNHLSSRACGSLQQAIAVVRVGPRDGADRRPGEAVDRVVGERVQAAAGEAIGVSTCTCACRR